ncbi:non-ribosomal peptide synthetase [Nocardia sp. NPDC057668]|uniref:non-ribosomal peptide synthetase n=1 Tax=Nocardia sp. NPDC057668 TaxID=3346202 RepID=UPI00366E9409
MTPAASFLTLFQAQAARAPSRTAVVDGMSSCRYDELDRRSTCLAAELRRRGIGRGDLAAVLIENSLELVVALLAVMKAGGCYLPVDPRDPKERIESLLTAARPVLCLTRDGSCPVSAAVPVIDVGGACLGQSAGSALSPVTLSHHDLAYLIFTSGSTGSPKGVLVEHGALASYLLAATRECPGLDGRVLVHSSPAFDFSLTCLLGALTSGGTLVVRTDADLDDTNPADEKYTFVKLTPGHLELVRHYLPGWWPSRTLMVAGEAATASVLAPWRASNPDVTIVNEYGPTETTVGCCLHVVDSGQVLESGSVPIGGGLLGTETYVLDDRLEPADFGELYIAGPQIARGYLERFAATASRFVANPFDTSGSRMYRTGDLVRRRHGVLEYVARADRQITIGGFRIEPEEVAATLMCAEGVARAAVISHEPDYGAVQLVAFVTVQPSARCSPMELRAFLAERLPSHLVPAHVVILARIPLTHTGKTDVAALSREFVPAGASATGAVLTADEDMLCRLASDVLGGVNLGPDDDFFGQGGTSMAAARLVTRARAHGFTFGLTDVLRNRTVRKVLGPSFTR